MSKVTPSALRGLSVAAGTVGLAAVGAAATAGQASAAASGPAGLAGGGGLPVSTNAVPAVFGAVAHNHGTIAGIPLSGFPMIGRLPGMFSDASPTSDSLPGLGYEDLGEVPLTRSRPMPGAQGERTTHIARHAAPAAAPAPAVPTFPPAAAPMRQAPAPMAAPAAQAPAAQAPKAQAGPLDNVTNALHGLPVLGGLAGGLPLGGLPLGGLTNLGG